MPVRISPALLVVQGALSADSGPRTRARRAPRALVLQRVHIIDGTGAPTKLDRAVCVLGGCVEAIGPADQLSIPAGARVVDAGGAFLIPGLWDMHVHLAHAGEAWLPLLVANGVTTVRDVGEPAEEVQPQLDAWRRRIEAGMLIGPRILSQGRPTSDADWMDDLRQRASLMFPGFSVHDELELLVRRVGQTPLQALMGATRAPAEHFGLHRELGTIEPGKIADVVLLDADPLQDIRNTRRIRGVVQGGRLVVKASRAGGAGEARSLAPLALAHGRGARSVTKTV